MTLEEKKMTGYSKAKSAGYSVGDEPKLGAIACWESWNHVAIVEKIESGNIYVSQYNRKGEEKFGGLDKYSNGSEKKDASGNNIWTAWEMMGVKGSRKGKAGGTPSYYIYLKEDSATVKTTITFNLVTPSSFTVGTDIALDGSMSATGSKINSVKVEIVNAANGSVVLSASSSGNFSVETYGPLVAKNSKLNSDLDLGKLPVGTYYARFTVGTKDGATASEETGRFNVNPISCNGNHTRGEYLGSADTHPHWVSWAKMVFCITTGRVSEGDYASEYIDMYCNLTDIQGCWAEGFIKYLTVADVVSGNGSGKYQPWSSVTVVEAAKTMLTTLGYDAQDRGYVNNVAWDTNIMADARRIGLMDGIDQQPKDELNRDNAAQMIYNALRCNTQCFFNGSYTEGDTLLRSVFHIGAIVFD